MIKSKSKRVMLIIDVVVIFVYAVVSIVLYPSFLFIIPIGCAMGWIANIIYHHKR